MKEQIEKKMYARSDIKESIEDYKEVEEALEFQLMISNVIHTSNISLDKRHAYILFGLLKERLFRAEIEERLGKDGERTGN